MSLKKVARNQYNDQYKIDHSYWDIANEDKGGTKKVFSKIAF